MQHAWKHVERPGGSHTALDGKKSEMTRILREKQSHPLIAQMMKPAESSDPPPANAAVSSSGSRDQSCTSQSVQFQ